MLHIYFACALFYAFSITVCESATIRSVTVKSDLLIPIHTSIGYSTILEFQEKPTSSILGDQDAFKLEYVGNSITLKPLFNSAKSNLFVYTSFDRFNFSLITSPPPNTDYVVRIKRASEDNSISKETRNYTESSPYSIIPIRKKFSQSGFALTVQELQLAKDQNNPRSASLIKFDLSSNGENYRFLPASFGIKQGNQFLDVEGIYLERMSTARNDAPVNGVIAVLNQQWKRNLPLTFIFAYQREIKKKIQTGKISITFSAVIKSLKRENADGKAGLFTIPKK